MDLQAKLYCIRCEKMIERMIDSVVYGTNLLHWQCAVIAFEKDELMRPV